MNDLKDKIERAKKRESRWYDNILINKNNINKMSSNFRFLEYEKAVYELLSFNFKESKQHFHTVSLIDKYRVERYNNRLFDFGLPYVCLPILSDDDNLIQEYSKLRYQRGRNSELSMDEMVQRGESAIWCNTVQFFMASNFEGVERNLNILETITLPSLPKNQQTLKIDYEFYKALLFKNKEKCEELIEELVSFKVHKERNDNVILSKYISQPAIGYAKLAWYLGVEVEVNSSLLPKEILPIVPLRNYDVPYGFLRENMDV